jgi:hypothetical protein
MTFTPALLVFLIVGAWLSPGHAAASPDWWRIAFVHRKRLFISIGMAIAATGPFGHAAAEKSHSRNTPDSGVLPVLAVVVYRRSPKFPKRHNLVVY